MFLGLRSYIMTSNTWEEPFWVLGDTLWVLGETLWVLGDTLWVLGETVWVLGDTLWVLSDALSFGLQIGLTVLTLFCFG